MHTVRHIIRILVFVLPCFEDWAHNMRGWRPEPHSLCLNRDISALSPAWQIASLVLTALHRVPDHHWRLYPIIVNSGLKKLRVVSFPFK